MAQRRSSFSSDSLELLLDTICNVFGGIILMAILVVLLTQTSAGRLPDPKPEDIERAFQAERLSFERRQLEQRLADLYEHRGQIKETFQATTSETGERLADARGQFHTAVQKASARLQQTNATVKECLKQNGQAARQLNDVKRRVHEKEEVCAQLQDQMRHAESAVSQKVRLPHRKGAASGKSVYYVVKGDRAYPLERARWDGGTHRSGHCYVTPVFGHEAATVRPIEGEGYPAPVGETSAGAFQASLMLKPPASHYIVFFVYDDSASYASFQALKDLVVAEHYAYTAAPVVVEGGGFTVVPVSHHQTE